MLPTPWPEEDSGLWAQTPQLLYRQHIWNTWSLPCVHLQMKPFGTLPSQELYGLTHPCFKTTRWTNEEKSSFYFVYLLGSSAFDLQENWWLKSDTFLVGSASVFNIQQSVTLCCKLEQPPIHQQFWQTPLLCPHRKAIRRWSETVLQLQLSWGGTTNSSSSCLPPFLEDKQSSEMDVFANILLHSPSHFFFFLHVVFSTNHMKINKKSEYIS